MVINWSTVFHILVQLRGFFFSSFIFKEVPLFCCLWLGNQCFITGWSVALKVGGTNNSIQLEPPIMEKKKYLSHLPIWILQDAAKSLHFCSCRSFMTGSVNFTHGCLLGKYFPDLHVYSIDMWSWGAFLLDYGTSTHRLHTNFIKSGNG